MNKSQKVDSQLTKLYLISKLNNVFNDQIVINGKKTIIKIISKTADITKVMPKITSFITRFFLFKHIVNRKHRQHMQ